MAKKNSESGFTLIEMMVTVAILAILVVLAVPALDNLRLSNKLTSYTNDFVASVNLARSEAIKRNSQVTLCATTCATSSSTCSCATSGGWNQGWVLLWDSESDGSLSDDATDVLSRHPALKTGMQFNEASYIRSLTFEPNGVGSTQATLTLCQNSPSVGSKEKVIAVSATGRTTVSMTETGSCP